MENTNAAHPNFLCASSTNSDGKERQTTAKFKRPLVDISLASLLIKASSPKACLMNLPTKSNFVNTIFMPYQWLFSICMKSRWPLTPRLSVLVCVTATSCAFDRFFDECRLIIRLLTLFFHNSEVLPADLPQL